MRLWSISPKYLDCKGLVALWREALLAKKVIEEKTKGYKSHPQLERFKRHSNPRGAINTYLKLINEEAKRRGYNFNPSKIGKIFTKIKIPVTKGQLEYEFEHLKSKLLTRDKEKYFKLSKRKRILPNKLFKVIDGKIEGWEKL